MIIDYLIIGQGLAGSLLAWQLHQLGQRLLIVDDASASAASRVAAGLITPITGKRLVKSADLDLHLPAAKSCYQQLEQHLSERFYYQRPITRVLQSNEEVIQYEKRALDRDYHPYLSHYKQHPHAAREPSSHVTVNLNQGGFVDSALLVKKLGGFFIEQGIYRRAHVEYTDIHIDSDQAQWQEVTARKLIFCEGYSGMHNPWFNWLPFTPTKGEILQCSIDEPISESIIHAGKWLLPLDTHTFRCGATYDWHTIDLNPTLQAREELLTSANRLFPHAQIEVINHQVGIRPGTKDRHAFIGAHRELGHLFIFNGFGSKGALTIPYYSKQFIKLLTGDSKPMRKTDIARYY